MSGKNFKDLLQNVSKRKFRQKVLDTYESSRVLRRSLACGAGFIATFTVLVMYPGSSFPMQTTFKKFTSRTMFELMYLQAVAFDSTASWLRVLNSGEKRLVKFRRDVNTIQRIEHPEFVSQCIDLLNIVIKRTPGDKLNYFLALKSLGFYLYDTANLNPNIFKHPDVKKSLMSLMENARKYCEFNDKISLTVENTEWNCIYSLFLVICEYGNEEKVKAYKDLNEILRKQKGILKLACDENFVARVFGDTVSGDREVVRMALENLEILSEDSECQLYFVKKLLVYNLFTKVKEKNPEFLFRIQAIVRNLSVKEYWDGEVMVKEKKRLSELGKEEKDEVLRSLIKLFTS